MRCRIAFATVSALAVFTACAAEDASPTPPLLNDAGVEASAPDSTAEPTGIVVQHDRELRGAWISTVFNGTWPSKTGLSIDAAKTELLGIFDALASAKMNTVFFQIRAESDAVYASSLEPWSRFLTGTQGQDPGWDPLSFAIDEGHRRGLEVHAWFNPYRALTSSQVVAAPSHVTKMLASSTRAYGTQLWMDPGDPLVRAHILDVVRDVLQRYDVDGVHFDDYFYPYPIAGEAFDDASTFATHGGMLAKDDWRRSNVDLLVKETSSLVSELRQDVRFGISPFGIYRPGTPEGITGLDAYAAIYCDPVRWMNEGWVDYLAPQLYWPSTQTAQAFGKLTSWWASIAKDHRSIFIGHDATKAGEGAFTISEYETQMKLVRAERSRGALGSIFFSAKPLVLDQAGLRSMLAKDVWTLPASTPALAASSSASIAPSAPSVVIDGRTIKVATPDRTRAIAIYRGSSDSHTIERIVPVAATETTITLEIGRYLVSTLSRAGIESRASETVIE